MGWISVKRMGCVMSGNGGCGMGRGMFGVVGWVFWVIWLRGELVLGVVIVAQDK